MNPAIIKEDTIQNFKNPAQDLRGNSNGLSNETKSDLRNTADIAKNKVSGLIDSASDEIAQTTDKVTKEIRNNPVQASLIALGAGFILGSLFRR